MLLFYQKKKYIKMFSMLFSIFIFSIIYSFFPNNYFYVAQFKKDRKVTYIDKLYFSFSTQSLLGIGDILPHKKLQIIIIMQIITSLYIMM